MLLMYRHVHVFRLVSLFTGEPTYKEQRHGGERLPLEEPESAVSITPRYPQ